MKLSERLRAIANGETMVPPGRNQRWFNELSEEAALMERRLAATGPKDPALDAVKEKMRVWRNAQKRHAAIVLGISKENKADAQSAMEAAERQLMILADALLS